MWRWRSWRCQTGEQEGMVGASRLIRLCCFGGINFTWNAAD